MISDIECYSLNVSANVYVSIYLLFAKDNPADLASGVISFWTLNRLHLSSATPKINQCWSAALVMEFILKEHKAF